MELQILFLVFVAVGHVMLSVDTRHAHCRRTIDARLAKKWAPRVWLAKGEKFYPSSVTFFLSLVKMVDSKGETVPEQPKTLTESNLPTGETNYYLTTKEKLECPGCTNIPKLHGQNPMKNSVPVYAIVRETDRDITDIFYWFLYPYNKGKTVCQHNMNYPCFGKSHQFGDHVGDWEHISIRFFKGYPTEMYVAIHSFGKTYTWDGSHFRDGTEVVSMHDCHPVIYSARGSHGSWVTPGRHDYLHVFGITLFDDTSDGISWDTWKNLEIINFHKDHLHYHGRNTFMRFQGLWGNKEEGCDYKALVGVCTLGWGPPSINPRSIMQKAKIDYHHLGNAKHNVAKRELVRDKNYCHPQLQRRDFLCH